MASNVFSQTNLNNYKYVIVAKKFDFLKKTNEYRLNELSQFLFNKYGFEALIEGEEYPSDLLVNRCLGLKADVLKDSGMFKTKLSVELKDCNDRIVYTSEVGESREKQFDKAYTEALRNAFISIEALNYKYVPNEAILASTSSNIGSDNSDEVKKLREEVQALREKKELEENIEEIKNRSNPVFEKPKVSAQLPVEKLTTKHEILYAQAIDHGFQLVDSTPSVVYKIKKTGIDNVFLVEGKNATLYQKEDKWILEYYENDQLIQEVLTIKF
ncbi:hypothetical protein APS56_13885 [Pseudalgibacter alginicilyticus]|uniref:Uncharacterized protein n=1 Tax=Pseudalgibacter alginicilyticus TaxID=1736674 RepID=A0A0P0DDD0_9FLAO|nr:hypothetical protein [Pseudalgibacter alginicilyticus]ALJ06152.1 hypothetical protein APS56_13885 [Pseudalgibacter alginicilyticus]